jgi:hypothetical protein
MAHDESDPNYGLTPPEVCAAGEAYDDGVRDGRQQAESDRDNRWRQSHDNQPFFAGDAVVNLTSGEEWLLACDEESGEVICAGWPETLEKAFRCRLVKRTSHFDRLSMLKEVSEGGCADQMRGRRAMRQLAELTKPAPGVQAFQQTHQSDSALSEAGKGEER